MLTTLNPPLSPNLRPDFQEMQARNYSTILRLIPLASGRIGVLNRFHQPVAIADTFADLTWAIPQTPAPWGYGDPFEEPMQLDLGDLGL